MIMPTTKKMMMHGCVIILAILGALMTLTTARDGVQTNADEMQTIKDVSGVAQCATSAPNKTFTVRSRLDCMRICHAHGRSCAFGANYRGHIRICELYSEDPGSFEQMPNCVYYQRKDDRPAEIASLQEHCMPLLFLQNVDGSCFYRSWQEFKWGFGSKAHNYWLGNELLHQLTKDGLYKLRFDLKHLVTGIWYWAEYGVFIVDSETAKSLVTETRRNGNVTAKYQLTARNYSGDAGDALGTHDGRMFSTYDSDNDIAATNCADERGGGWWWKKCGPAAVTACMGGGTYSYAWKKLPQSNKNLNTTRAWVMCP